MFIVILSQNKQVHQTSARRKLSLQSEHAAVEPNTKSQHKPDLRNMDLNAYQFDTAKTTKCLQAAQNIIKSIQSHRSICLV